MGNKRYIIIVVSILVAVILLFLARSIVVTGNFVVESDRGVSSFVKCLNEKGVYLYSYGEENQQVKFQLNMFDEFSKNISVVNCAESPGQCVGVVVYPSWNIDGRIISGGLSLGILSQFSGCGL